MKKLFEVFKKKKEPEVVPSLEVKKNKKFIKTAKAFKKKPKKYTYAG